jgi:hypothetical protein
MYFLPSVLYLTMVGKDHREERGRSIDNRQRHAVFGGAPRSGRNAERDCQIVEYRGILQVTAEVPVSL